MRRKLLRLAGEVARRAGEGFSHPRIIPQGKQKGHYGRRKGNKRVVTTPQGERKGRYDPVGVRPPPPLRGSSPCKAGQFIPAGFDCRHSEVCKSRNSAPPNCLNSFSISVKSPKMRTVPSSKPLKLGVPCLWNWVFQALELGVPGLWNWVFQAFGTGCFRLWNWVFQALKLGVSGFETGCFRL